VINATIQEIDLRFETSPKLFSPGGVDEGTLAMLSRVVFEPADKVLDLGCGYGPVGVLAATLTAPGQVWMVDSDPLAVDVATRNLALNGVRGVHCLVSDGFRGLAESGFSKILVNPPYHADFSVPKHMIEKGFNRLVVGGSLWMVTKRDAWYRNKLTAIFGGVKAEAVDGYWVFEAVKKRVAYAKAG
jgi:16S rRNA (guanine1207-N2)-methyltransferase